MQKSSSEDGHYLAWLIRIGGRRFKFGANIIIKFFIAI